MRTLLGLLGVTLALWMVPSPAAAPDDPRPDAFRSSHPDQGITPPTSADDVVDYTLRATLDPVTHTVHGEGTIRWRNTSLRPTRELWLHLYLNAFKSERSAFLRERVGGRGSSTPADWGWIDVRELALETPGGPAVDVWPTAELHRPGDEDETDARVPLPREVEPGQSITLDVVFDDKLPTIVERTGYRGTFHMIGQWFPKIARLERDGRWAHFPFHHLAEFYSDFGHYDVTLDVPSTYTIGATGPVVGQRTADGRHIERHVQEGVHDFAWTAWDRWQTAHDRIDDIDVTVLYPPGFEAMAQRELATVRFALPYYSARYGAYPYRVLTLVHPQEDAGEAGGMEYPTLVTTGGAWWIPPALLTPEIVTIHELGHQWFYGLVATDESTWPFLDEGVNQYAEQDAMASWRGAGSAFRMAGLNLSDAAFDAVGGAMGVHDEPVAQPASAFDTGADYARLVYARTASVIETLARVYGKAQVARALGLYARRFWFQHPGPEDLLTVFAETMGPRVASTLRTALFDEGWVDYAVDSVSARQARHAADLLGVDKRDRADAGRVTGDFDNVVIVRRRGTLSFPVVIELTMADGTRQRESWDGDGTSRRMAWRGPVAVRGAVVDPDDRVLVDQNLENNGGSVVGSGGGAARTLERLTYWFQVAVQAVSP